MENLTKNEKQTLILGLKFFEIELVERLAKIVPEDEKKLAEYNVLRDMLKGSENLKEKLKF